MITVAQTIKIANDINDGWQVVVEYESDKLPSRSEDKKKLKTVREEAGCKPRHKDKCKDRVKDLHLIMVLSISFSQ